MDDNKMSGSVIFKLVGGIVGAIVIAITSIGVSIFQAIEDPTGEKGNEGVLTSIIRKLKSKKSN